MQKAFNKNLWVESLPYPDWYKRLENELQDVFSSSDEQRAYRHQVYEFVQEMLQKNIIPLANEGPDFDEERQVIDTIVVHHTKEEPNISLDKLSAIGLLRQYAMNYLKKDVLGQDVYGKAIWSGHFLNNKQVFFAYHWLIRPNGTSERLLEDTYIGRHAGNWDTNTRSIGIALSGDYEHSTPPIEQIKATAQVIKNYYPTVDTKNIFGHLEVMKNSTCPGNNFLGGWKNTLLKLF